MKALCIPEDFRHDQFILSPILEALLKHLGYRNVRVDVLTNPLLGGIAKALQRETLQSIVSRHRSMYDLILLCLDRDGRPEREAELNIREDWFRSQANFLGVAAHQEIETWVLAGHTLPAEWSWLEVQREANVKERFYRPFARAKGVLLEPGEGRKSLAREAARNYARKVRSRCTPDLLPLESRIRERLSCQ